VQCLHDALKRFLPALEDCQQASSLQSSSPQPKTLIRLAHGHYALGLPTAALTALQTALSMEPKNASALQLQKYKSSIFKAIHAILKVRRQKGVENGEVGA